MLKCVSTEIGQGHEDPLKGDTTNPQQRNRYPYALNNPLVMYDLNGLYVGEGYLEAAEMAVDWLTGTGPTYTAYGPESQQVQEMKSSPGVQQAIDDFYSQNPGKCDSEYLKLQRHKWFFGLSGAMDAGFNPTRQFVGGYEIEVTANPDQTITITIYNKTCMSSFMPHTDNYYSWPESSDYDRVSLGGITFPIPGANTYQTYSWTEPMR